MQESIFSEKKGGQQSVSALLQKGGTAQTSQPSSIEEAIIALAASTSPGKEKPPKNPPKEKPPTSHPTSIEEAIIALAASTSPGKENPPKKTTSTAPASTEKPPPPTVTGSLLHLPSALPPDGLKKKINDEYFNNLHLFFGKKHLVTLCETIDPFLKLEQHQEVVILPSELEKQNKITEILLALVRNMIYNFSRGDVISGGGTLDQLKKTIKKRISEIKPKFIS
jgi:hypothetical protein